MRFAPEFLLIYAATMLAPVMVASAQSTLRVSLTGMSPHVGQKFELRVIDKATRLEAGRRSLAAIAAADFDVQLDVIAAGRSYWIDFYADLNQNGAYDAPPADHAWRDLFSSASGDTTLQFTHNTNFTDIGWPGTAAVEALAGTAGVPAAFALLQNYPNPFNPRTTIRFDLATGSAVKLVVYNSLGQLVRVLVNKPPAAGRYRAEWDGLDQAGRSLASGMYYYRLVAAEFTGTASMLLLK